MKHNRVQIYRNLHNGLLSVRDKNTKRVLCHAHGILLKDVTFTVSQNGRERVLRERRKNVHAWVEGEILMMQARAYKDRPVPEIEYNPEGLTLDLTRDFTYNPYNNDSFVDSDGNPVYNSPIAWLYVPVNGGALICKIPSLEEGK